MSILREANKSDDNHSGSKKTSNTQPGSVNITVQPYENFCFCETMEQL